MAIERIWTCDVCGRKKEETNHWWSLLKDSGEDGPFVVIYSGLLDLPGTLHACGEQHAHQLAGQLMKRLIPLEY